MTSSDFQLRGVSDPRLAVHATSALPAWLWSIDGSRVLWANPVAAKLFGAADAADLAGKTFGPADPHRRQVARLARDLPPSGAIRLERLRGFGAPLGTLMTCACARLEFHDGGQGVLVAAMAASGRGMPLVERLQRLVEGAPAPMAAFASDGLFVGASEAARPLLGFRDLAEAGLAQAGRDALARGRVETPIGIGHMVLQRVGSGADTALVALIELGATQAAHAMRHMLPEAVAEAAPAQCEPVPAAPALPDYEQPALSNEAPSEYTLFDAFAAPAPRLLPLRFLWQMDADGRFVLASNDFIRLIGTHTAAQFGRPWAEIARDLALDPEGRVARALATHDTWAGITVNWPVDGERPLAVELAGLPVYDRARSFAGFRGFGVCRDLDALNRLDALRRSEPAAVPQPARIIEAEAEPPPAAPEGPATGPELPEPAVETNSPPTDPDEAVETPPNVVPFRPLGEAKSPSLTPVENSAFNELARQLSERLERERDAAAAVTQMAQETAPTELPPFVPDAPRATAQWLTPPEPAPRGDSGRDRTLLDLLPTGILIYRLDRLLYANPALLARMGYASLQALEEAGGLDALYVEPGVSAASSTSEAGTPVTISATGAGEGAAAAEPTSARLHAIAWDGDSAHALICAPAQAAPIVVDAAAMEAHEPEPQPQAGHANAEDLAAILDTTAEGIIMFDAEGNITACNRSAEALFGHDGDRLLQENLATLFAPESRRVISDYLESLKTPDIASLLDHGREVLGRESKGGLIPLAMTMGRTRPDGPNFFAVFRDLSQSKQGESELREVKRLADRAAGAKADMLARISHEIRTPLNAIIGFAEVMISERFGALGNERYGEYLKDIRASGERVIAIIDDLLELTRIETGKLDLSFANLSLNDLVEACVVVMQPQANRERIIIRTSLAHALPPVHADARATRQIAMNLIGNSIRLAGAGGQVIVSTALTDRGEVALRIRDTGHGLSETDVAAAMEPFRTAPPSDSSETSGLSLSLTRALVEANRARFNIKSAANSGTLIEVVFSPTLARA
ncbi:PAS domain-containing protein [Bradyrhizobium sp.]|uniref:PAS domain-containing protein n=1 Tax=Bradyrhizobium sp. TaxID=376 RepID=UPI0023A582B6|nr:PAS domain-containing protein [Bradyrhizobium sp.]MDE2376118.1 PAS domain-containing protein [Bradyrhizobium sp.]